MDPDGCCTLIWGRGGEGRGHACKARAKRACVDHNANAADRQPLQLQPGTRAAARHWQPPAPPPPQLALGRAYRVPLRDGGAAAATAADVVMP